MVRARQSLKEGGKFFGISAAPQIRSGQRNLDLKKQTKLTVI
jgi:hypothetical protein